MKKTQRRIAREQKTVKAMLRLYCRAHHDSGTGLCLECAQLDEYADRRLKKCPYGEEKPTCVNCPIHCYRPEERESMGEVMRYAGPRMIWRHPILAIWHMIDGKRDVPELGSGEAD